MLQPSPLQPGMAILGGSFNPPHIGHLRLAIELCEALGERIQLLDLLPCGTHPHKCAAAMLPFALRASLVEACLPRLPGMRCNRMEGMRPGISYTWDTLQRYRLEYPGAVLYFILGSPDFSLLSTWYRGLELPTLCQLLVVPRNGQTAEDFVKSARELWPQTEECAPAPFASHSLQLFDGGWAHFVPVPWLAVSASRIRQHWLRHRNIDLLVPQEVLRMLDAHQEEVRSCWQREDPAC